MRLSTGTIGILCGLLAGLLAEGSANANCSTFTEGTPPTIANNFNLSTSDDAGFNIVTLQPFYGEGYSGLNIFALGDKPNSSGNYPVWLYSTTATGGKWENSSFYLSGLFVAPVAAQQTGNWTVFGWGGETAQKSGSNNAWAGIILPSGQQEWINLPGITASSIISMPASGNNPPNNSFPGVVANRTYASPVYSDSFSGDYNGPQGPVIYPYGTIIESLQPTSKTNVFTWEKNGAVSNTSTDYVPYPLNGPNLQNPSDGVKLGPGYKFATVDKTHSNNGYVWALGNSDYIWVAYAGIWVQVSATNCTPRSANFVQLAAKDYNVYALDAAGNVWWNNFTEFPINEQQGTNGCWMDTGLRNVGSIATDNSSGNDIGFWGSYSANAGVQMSGQIFTCSVP